jgi:hypothetical protein
MMSIQLSCFTSNVPRCDKAERYQAMACRDQDDDPRFVQHITQPQDRALAEKSHFKSYAWLGFIHEASYTRIERLLTIFKC